MERKGFEPFFCLRLISENSNGIIYIGDENEYIRRSKKYRRRNNKF